MSTSRQSLGRWGESLATDYLVEGGYTILERNARTPYGEIDLVAQQLVTGSSGTSSVTVFVEVKTRSSRAFGFPEEAITARKQAHMMAAAQSYLQEHPELDDGWRIDVIAIQRYSSKRKPTIMHYENALT